MLATEGGSTMLFGRQNFPKSFSNNIFPEIFSEQILHFLKILQFYHVRAPSPQVGPPFFTFLGGVTPRTPPQVARPCELLRTALDNQSLLYNILLKSINPYSIYYVMTAILCNQKIFCQTLCTTFFVFCKTSGMIILRHLI
jgi:hypothetical protein